MTHIHIVKREMVFPDGSVVNLSEGQLDTISNVGVAGHVTAILQNVHTKNTSVYITKNIVTTEGDIFYAKKACGETPSNFTTIAMELGIGGSAPGKSSNRSAITTKVGLALLDSGFPKTDDSDTENTTAGVNVVTYKKLYGTADANGTGIDRVALTNYASGTPGANEPLLSYATITSFNKTSNDTLKMIVNHSITGV